MASLGCSELGEMISCHVISRYTQFVIVEVPRSRCMVNVGVHACCLGADLAATRLAVAELFEDFAWAVVWMLLGKSGAWRGSSSRVTRWRPRCAVTQRFLGTWRRSSSSVAVVVEEGDVAEASGHVEGGLCVPCFGGVIPGEHVFDVYGVDDVVNHDGCGGGGCAGNDASIACFGHVEGEFFESGAVEVEEGVVSAASGHVENELCVPCFGGDSLGEHRCDVYGSDDVVNHDGCGGDGCAGNHAPTASTALHFDISDESGARKRLRCLACGGVSQLCLLSYFVTAQLMRTCGTVDGVMVEIARLFVELLGGEKKIESNVVEQTAADTIKRVGGSASPEMQSLAVDNGSDECEDVAAEAADSGGDLVRWKEHVRRAVKSDLWFLPKNLDKKALLCGRSFFSGARRGLPRPQLMSRAWAKKCLEEECDVGSGRRAMVVGAAHGQMAVEVCGGVRTHEVFCGTSHPRDLNFDVGCL
eukprot:TRINITY_DN19281_c0_g1_i2.p1 TRINITY_DN19281_c0_g1~~TRINITY_DN19281_c0_g1_i2.p1  ORF type:complete len:473 (-),score=88.08 TRINITY_DN19281_c0_g1_i2:52-1470(-)